MSTIVTSYKNADTDGASCTVAYREFLSKKGTKAKILFSEKPDPMASFALKYFGKRLKRPKISEKDRIILVDASQVAGLSKAFSPSQVVEIIDHRPSSRDLHLFPNAKIQNEPVGAAATLVAERFFKERIPISRESAGLLYSGIVANTLNFQSKATCRRDRSAAKKLISIARIPKNYLRLFFKSAEKFSSPLPSILEMETAVQPFSGGALAVTQIDGVNGLEFVRKNKDAIEKSLPKIFRKRKASFGFLSCLDILNKRNVFFAQSAEARKFILERVGKTRFSGNVGIRRPPILRKEIWMLLD